MSTSGDNQSPTRFLPRRLILWVAALLIIGGLGVLESNAQEQTQTPTGTFTETPYPAPGVTHAGGCVNLDSRLQQLASADDPAAFAQTSGLEYDGARVRVVIELSGDAGPDPAVYGLDIEGQYANLLQARVPVDQLCAVAGDPTVSGVRPPSFGVPVTG